jgi:uncharacterized membrane protein YdjX (TVP38/TMEM64 family)
MSEAKALVILFICVSIVAVAASALLSVVNADGAAFGLVVTVLVSLGGWIAGCIVVRYGRLKERREREEILLRR